MRARDNPLAADRVLAIRYKPQEWTWDDLLARLESFGYRAAIVGPHGTGKTTLLEDLTPWLRSRGYEPVLLRLDSTNRRLDRVHWGATHAAGPRHILLLDGAEQLSPMQWLCFRYRSRNAGGLVITTHRPGRLPTLVRTRTSAPLLDQILTELGARCAEPEGLFHRHGGNIREAIRELYDRLSGVA